MLELLFLLLPIATLYGWYMGKRSVRKEQDAVADKFSRDYVTGLNFLLTNQHEQAVDLFLSMLQKQSDENDIAIEPQFEAELTLGNLFRSRGEIDKALRIHQALDASEHYSTEQKLIVKQQLAKDFFSAGFYDRAENYYISLVNEPDFAVHSLIQLMDIYHRTQEWKKAINVAEKCLKIAPEMNKIPLSHYLCEYAQAVGSEEKNQFVEYLTLALHYHPHSARASILLGQHYLNISQPQIALTYFEQILEQDPDYISEVLPHIKQCYLILKNMQNFELFLIKANQIKHNSMVGIALAESIEQSEGRISAQTNLYQQMNQHPNIITFHHFIHYQILEANEGSGKESLILLHKFVGNQIERSFKYRCINCGYQSYRLAWCCPSCRQWEKIKPIYSINETM